MPETVKSSGPGSVAGAAGRPAVRYRRWLHGLAMALVAATFILVAIGGSVTSYDAGMAVPDGFTTFGYWSLTAPLEVWWHDLGTRLEHSHRLKGYVVGWLTIGVLVGVLATQRRRRWVVGLAVGLLVFVVLQGVLGILRVDEVSLWLAGVHGVTGQIFLGLTVVMAAAVGRVWLKRSWPENHCVECGYNLRGNVSGACPECGRAVGADDWPKAQKVPKLAWVWLALLLVQLSLGSAVRHGQAALAIPDWPMHYGSVLPPMSEEAVGAAVAALPEATQAKQDAAMLGEAVTAWRVHLHFTHRVMAYAVTVFGIVFLSWVWKRWRDTVDGGLVKRVVLLVGGLLALQVTLGVYTVISGVHPTMATLHQTVGAALLAASVWLAVRMKLVGVAREATEVEGDAAVGRPTVSDRGLQGAGVTA